MRTCPHCLEDTGDAARCEHCGELLFRYATDDLPVPETTPAEARPAPTPEVPAAPPVPPDPFGADPFASDLPAPPAWESRVESSGPRLSVPQVPPPATGTVTRSTKQGPNGCAIAAIVLGGIVVLAMVALFFVGRSLVGDGEFFENLDFPVGDQVDWGQVRVGDCINFVDAIDQGEDTLVSTLDRVDCFEAHDAEVYALFDLADGAWPGADVAYFEGDTHCYEQFEAYVGIDYMDSYYFYEVYTPTPDSWATGDRTVACALVDPSDVLTKPLRDSRE